MVLLILIKLAENLLMLDSWFNEATDFIRFRQVTNSWGSLQLFYYFVLFVKSCSIQSFYEKKFWSFTSSYLKTFIIFLH